MDEERRELILEYISIPYEERIMNRHKYEERIIGKEYYRDLSNLKKESYVTKNIQFNSIEDWYISLVKEKKSSKEDGKNNIKPVNDEDNTMLWVGKVYPVVNDVILTNDWIVYEIGSFEDTVSLLNFYDKSPNTEEFFTRSLSLSLDSNEKIQRTLKLLQLRCEFFYYTYCDKISGNNVYFMSRKSKLENQMNNEEIRPLLRDSSLTDEQKDIKEQEIIKKYTKKISEVYLEMYTDFINKPKTTNDGKEIPESIFLTYRIPSDKSTAFKMDPLLYLKNEKKDKLYKNYDYTLIFSIQKRKKPEYIDYSKDGLGKFFNGYINLSINSFKLRGKSKIYTGPGFNISKIFKVVDSDKGENSESTYSKMIKFLELEDDDDDKVNDERSNDSNETLDVGILNENSNTSINSEDSKKRSREDDNLMPSLEGTKKLKEEDYSGINEIYSQV